MERRDYLLFQIEQIGKVLRKMVAKLSGLDNDVDTSIRIKEINLELKSEIDIDIDSILSLNKTELKQHFETTNLASQNMEIIAEYIFVMAEKYIETNPNAAKNYFQSSLSILEIIDEITMSFSFERMERKSLIQNRIENL
jgi:predicted transcriptional regulator